MLAGIPVTLASNAYWALALISLATWGYTSWATMGQTLPVDIFPQDVVASVAGLTGFCGAVMGIIFTLAAGSIVDRFSYYPVFVAAGVSPLVATAAILILVREPQGSAKG